MRKFLHALTALLALAACSAPQPAPEIPVFADLDLVGYYHREPRVWTADRFAPHVSFVDAEGQERWLFEAYLFIEAHDPVRDRMMSVAPYGHSARKDSWEDQLQLWLGPEGGVAQLDRAIAAAAARIGDPPRKRQVVITVPDAIMLEHFADKSSVTKYWGALDDGRELDFAAVEDQLAALYWYIDRARTMFAALDCRHLELGGFYIVSEDLPVAYGETEAERLNCRYKRWETIVPALSAYCHAAGQGLYWIPYHLAPGYKYWKRLGFDQAWMQPNWYWDLKHPGAHPFDKTIEAIKTYGMGMELEFEYSLVSSVMAVEKAGPDGAGQMVFGEADVPALKEQLRDYMRRFKEAGLYGVAPLALYSGSNALTQLATSPDPEDQALYREFCTFIADSPLRHGNPPASPDGGTLLQDGKTAVAIGEDGTLRSLCNLETGTDYAGGRGLWRLYYNTKERKEIEVRAAGQQPRVSSGDGAIRIDYDRLVGEGDTLDISLQLSVTLEEGQVRFAARLENREPHTIVRELQYPLVGDLALPEGFRLLTTHTGGQIFDNPQQTIADIPTRALYMTPAQKFRQYELQYPRNAASNCYAFAGEQEGLYLGSHDPSLQQTWHGLRAYPNRGEECSSGRWQDFGRLEAGFYRYPNACCGDVWTNDCSVLVPYRGDWTETARLYRAWADSWWEKQEPVAWAKDMTGWQRIIFKHQYGEYLRRYSDLPGRIFEAGEKAGCNTVLAFGWWDEGMDNGYPDYSPDASQGGDAAWAEAIAAFRAKGGRLIQYYNGRLIDVESDFYRSGQASTVSNHDNTGREFTEHYKFTGEGTTLGYYDSRTFVIADMSRRSWRDKLLRMADRAMATGADAVFYDQLGVAEEFPDWDLSGEFPIQDLYTGLYKAEALKEIRDYVKAQDPSFGLGTEWLSDCTSQYCDFVHIVEFTALPESFPEWFRYAFPEVIWSDRCVRDEADMTRRVGNTLLKGLRNDIEVFRCRGLIDETPAYQKYLRAVNDVRHAFPSELLAGRFIHTDGIVCPDPDIVVRGYASWPEGQAPSGIGLPTDNAQAPARIAVVATTPGSGRRAARIRVPGYHLTDRRTIGDATAFATGQVSLRQYGIAVLLFEKD
ncbi:MAG: DUF4855 domain-containing protein [Bacteroidales bacterium]|nr:DUF4855 domain-containing protein [Bacteroidales bacterium]